MRTLTGASELSALARPSKLELWPNRLPVSLLPNGGLPSSSSVPLSAEEPRMRSMEIGAAWPAAMAARARFSPQIRHAWYSRREPTGSSASTCSKFGACLCSSKQAWHHGCGSNFWNGKLPEPWPLCARYKRRYATSDTQSAIQQDRVCIHLQTDRCPQRKTRALMEMLRA